MLKNKLQNFHHSRIPELGEIGHLTGCSTFPKNRVRVVAFPLCDSPLWRGRRYSFGIHTAFYQDLANGEIFRASGFWFKSE